MLYVCTITDPNGDVAPHAEVFRTTISDYSAAAARVPELFPGMWPDPDDFNYVTLGALDEPRSVAGDYGRTYAGSYLVRRADRPDTSFPQVECVRPPYRPMAELTSIEAKAALAAVVAAVDRGDDPRTALAKAGVDVGSEPPAFYGMSDRVLTLTAWALAAAAADRDAVAAAAGGAPVTACDMADLSELAGRAAAAAAAEYRPPAG